MNRVQLREQVRTFLGHPPTDEYTDAQIDIQLNLGYHEAIDYAIQADGEWQVNGESATTNIVSGQKEYALTTNVPLLTLNRIEINTSGLVDDWDKLSIADMRSMDSSIQSSYSCDLCDIFDNRIILYKTPTADVANGLKIWYQKDVVDLDDNNYYVELEEAAIDPTDLTLGYKTIVINGLEENLSVSMIQNTTDDLVVTHVGDLLTIKLANTTAAKNTAALIQAAIRVEYAGATVQTYNWTNILGTTIHYGSEICIEEVKDTPQMPDICQMYLVWFAVRTYAIDKSLSDKLKEAKEGLATTADRIKTYYANRLKAKPKKLGQRVESYN